MFPRRNGVATISKFLVLNVWISVPLTDKELFYSIIMQAQTKSFIFSCKIN